MSVQRRRLRAVPHTPRASTRRCVWGTACSCSCCTDQWPLSLCLVHRTMDETRRFLGLLTGVSKQLFFDDAAVTDELLLTELFEGAADGKTRQLPVDVLSCVVVRAKLSPSSPGSSWPPADFPAAKAAAEKLLQNAASNDMDLAKVSSAAAATANSLWVLCGGEAGGGGDGAIAQRCKLPRPEAPLAAHSCH